MRIPMWPGSSTRSTSWRVDRGREASGNSKNMSPNLLPAVVDGGIPIVGGVLATLFGYGILRTSKQASRLAQGLKWLGPVVVLFGIWLLLDDLRTLPGDALARELKDTEAAVNKRLPMMVDDVTRADRIEAGDSELTYFFTVIGRGKAASDGRDFQAAMSDKLLGQACSNSDYQRLLKEDVTLRMVYRSEEREELAMVVVSPSLYKERCQA